MTEKSRNSRTSALHTATLILMLLSAIKLLCFSIAVTGSGAISPCNQPFIASQRRQPGHAAWVKSRSLRIRKLLLEFET